MKHCSKEIRSIERLFTQVGMPEPASRSLLIVAGFVDGISNKGSGHRRELLEFLSDSAEQGHRVVVACHDMSDGVHDLVALWAQKDGIDISKFDFQDEDTLPGTPIDILFDGGHIACAATPYLHIGFDPKDGSPSIPYDKVMKCYTRSSSSPDTLAPTPALKQNPVLCVV